jgi:hypothetical protein
MADVVTLWGDADDTIYQSAVADKEGVCTKALYESLKSTSDIDQLHGTDGDYIINVGGKAYTNAGSNGTIPFTDTSGILEGMYCYVDDVSAGNNTNGRYLIETVTLNTSITISSDNLDGTISDLDTNDTVSVFIGGVRAALEDDVSLQLALNEAGNDYANGVNNVDILCHASTATTLTATIDIDNITGDTNNRVEVFSCDVNFVRSDGAVEITTGTAITALFQFYALSDYVHFYGFNFNGQTGAAGATYCLYKAQDNADGIQFINCEIQNAVDHGIFFFVTVATDSTDLIGCSIHDNGGDGVSDVSSRGAYRIVDSDIYDNAENGTNTDQDDTLIENCRIWGNGLAGIHLNDDSDGARILGNSVFDNGTDGIKVMSAGGFLPRTMLIKGNTSTKNGDFGYNFTSLDALSVSSVFGKNHAEDNDQDAGIAAGGDYCNLTASLVEFELLGIGGNIGGAALFDSETPGDAGFLRPSSTSPLVTPEIGARWPTAGGGSGGLLTHTGMSGGLRG